MPVALRGNLKDFGIADVFQLIGHQRKTGQLEILRLRGRARGALGDGFELPAFHEAVLGGGGLPLVILSQAVEEWLLAAD